MSIRRLFAPCISGFLAVFALACASLSGHADFDSGADFAAYRTFAIIHPAPSEAGAPTHDIVKSPLIARRVELALREGLTSKGLAEAPADSADLHVAFDVSSRRAAEVVSYPGGPWPRPWWRDHWDRVHARIYTEGVLVVDLIDADTRRLVWRGWVIDAVSSRTDIDAEVRQAVDAVLSKYPPGPPPA